MEAASIQNVSLRTIFEDRVNVFSEEIQRNDVLRALVESIAASGKLAESAIDSTVQELIRREEAGSTGIGRGLAFPHLRTALVGDHVGAIAMVPEGMDFESLDRSPTRLVILLLSPQGTLEEHTTLMGRLARLMSDETLPYILRIPRSTENLFQILEF